LLHLCVLGGNLIANVESTYFEVAVAENFASRASLLLPLARPQNMRASAMPQNKEAFIFLFHKALGRNLFNFQN
jgi:hypothetical protein